MSDAREPAPLRWLSSNWLGIFALLTSFGAWYVQIISEQNSNLAKDLVHTVATQQTAGHSAQATQIAKLEVEVNSLEKALMAAQDRNNETHARINATLQRLDELLRAQLTLINKG